MPDHLVDRLTLFLIFVLFSFAFSQLPQRYILLSEFLQKRDLALGERLLRDYPNAVFVDDLRLLLAEEYYRRGELKRAEELLKEINPRALKFDYVERYAHLWRAMNLDKKTALLNLPHLFKDYIPEVFLTEEEKLKVGEGLIKKRQYREAINLLQDISKACSLLGEAYERLRLYKEAMEVLKNCDGREGTLRYARVVFNVSEEEFKRVLLRLKGYEEYNQALFYAGRLSLYRGDYQKALEWFSMVEEAYQKNFQLGLVLFILEDYQRAVDAFQKALNLSSSEEEKAQAHFWLYKGYEKLGDFQKAGKHLLKASNGIGFYSTMAKVQLGEPVAIKGLKVFFVSAEETSMASTLRSIVEAGFLHYARLEAFRNIDKLTTSDIIAIQKFDPFLAIRLAVRRFGIRSDIYQYVAYPTPYREFVEEAYKTFGVDKNLIWAIMRQESLFDPWAISPSGAKGLMQLMDFTVREVSQRYRILNSVFSPRENILLGTAYLREMIELWKGDWVRAIASYNAGPNRVRGFIQHAEPYVFIETIPISETRNYVKRVLENYYVYRALN
jgi:soluble lytic murein transglycosylase